MRTRNRLPPEGAWDYEIPGDLEDKTAAPAYVNLAQSTPILALGLLHNTKENIQMLKGWRTILVAMGVAVVGAAQAQGASWTEVLGQVNAGYLTMALGIVMGLLRGITNTAPGVK